MSISEFLIESFLNALILICVFLFLLTVISFGGYLGLVIYQNFGFIGGFIYTFLAVTFASFSVDKLF